MRPVLLVLLVLMLFMPASATIINVPADQPNIQAGIDASSDDDTVRVASGTYVENINFSGKNIVVGSWFLDDGDPSHISSTIIDGNAVSRVVTFASGETNDAKITGFTIQNGLTGNGGGIYCSHSNPTISNNTITGNSASSGSGHDGGGIYCYYSNPMITDNTITENFAGSEGGGIYCWESSPTISDNTISGNSTTSLGGGICCTLSSPTISNNTISGNTANLYGGGISCWESSPVITNTIAWGDIAPSAPEIFLADSSPLITYCDIEGGWAGEGNIDCDPMFCDPENGNFYLYTASCCVGAGEGGVDIGAYGVGCAYTINIPADYLTIQEGIDASSNGDTVRVAPGTYVENINFSGKNIVVGSWFLDDGDPSYISSTIIDGGASGSVVIFENGEDNSAVITGFTLQNGIAEKGGGIYCYYYSNPTISYNTISANSASDGGGIYCWGNADPTINYNTIAGNSAAFGGGIACYQYSNPAISNNTISGNSANYYGGGIYCWYSSPTISNNTISENSATYNGGGINCYHSNSLVTNTIFWGNSAPTGPEIYLQVSSPVITYCDVQGGWDGEGNIDCDPMFCDPENGNFYLNATSCCVGAGEGGTDIGAFGVGCAPPPPIILSVIPSQNELNVFPNSDISVTFDVDMDESTINSSTFVVNAMTTGLHDGAITYDAPSRTATFDPVEDFAEGEIVTVVLTEGIESSGGTALAAPYAWSFTIAADNGVGVFAPRVNYYTSNRTRTVFASDLDNDGDVDLAAANTEANNVSVLLNNGDGTFEARVNYPVGSTPHCVFASDLDGDGYNDLAVATYSGTNSLSILMNNGNGTFAAYVVYSIGSSSYSVFSSDLDGDGDLDLATANFQSHNISVLLNNGDGTFAAHVIYPLSNNSYPLSIFASDLDGDGDPDLATTSWSADNVSVLMNNGDGTFAPHLNYAVGGEPYYVFTSDLDGDGDLDLATANEVSNNVSVLMNNGDGTFVTHITYGAGSGPNDIFTSDLDGDGDLDLAVANFYSDNVSVLLNNGDGTFATHVTFPAGDGPSSVFASDLDGDGDIDLAAANQLSYNVSVLLNLKVPQIIDIAPSQNDLNVETSANISVTFDSDMDESTINSSTFVVNAMTTGLHDGAITYDAPSRTATLDPAMDFEEGEIVTVVLTEGIEAYEIPMTDPFIWSFTIAVDDGPGDFVLVDSYATDSPSSIFSSDLDGDGDLDLAATSWEANTISILLNNGDGTFATPVTYQVGSMPTTVFGGDFDADGDIDLATSTIGNWSVSVLMNNGDGTFAAQVIYTLDWSAWPSSVFASDLNGDGYLDLVTTNLNDNNVSVLLNNGDGNFGAYANYAVGTRPRNGFAADLDNDGDVDLAVTNYDATDVSVLLNNGDGTFATQVIYTVPSGPFAVFTSDLDGDGDLDLATSNPGTDNVSVLWNNGDGIFGTRSDISVGENPYSVFAGDFDGDGDIDLTTSNSLSDNVSVLMNNGDGTFAPHNTYPAGTAPGRIFASDLDGDGDLDLAVTNGEADYISVLLNQPPCDYIAGDCNHNGVPLELGDVITMIGMYRGTVEPEYTCNCPPNGDFFAPEGDPNGNCIAFELGDVVTEIGAYRGTAEASGCEDCPGSSRIGRGDGDQPVVSPTLKFKSKSSAGDR